MIRSIYYGQVCISANAFNYVWIIVILSVAVGLSLLGCFFYRCYRYRKLQNAKADADNQHELNADEPIGRDEYQRKLSENKRKIDMGYDSRGNSHRSNH